MADTRTAPGSRSSSVASPSRLPSARERRPALAALAVLLIVGGAFGSGWLALQAGNREQYLVLSEDVSAGQEITEAVVDEIELPENLEGLVPADQPEIAVGKRAAFQLPASTILTLNMVSDDEILGPNQQVVALPVKPAELPEGLEEGEIVSLITGSEDEEDGPGAIFYATAGPVVEPGEESSVGTDDEVTLNVIMHVTCVIEVVEAQSSGIFRIASTDQPTDEPGSYDCTSEGDGFVAGGQQSDPPGGSQGNGDG